MSLQHKQKIADIADKAEQLKRELAELEKEKAKSQQLLVVDLAKDAIRLTEEVFQPIFAGGLADTFDRLRQVCVEIVANDAKAGERLLGDRYGLPSSDGAKFLGQFVFVPVTNGQGLVDILARYGKHGDNPYVKQTEPAKPAEVKGKK